MSIKLLHQALASRGFEVINQQEAPTRLQIRGRVQRNLNVERNWLLVVYYLLDWDGPCGIDISKQYVKHDGQLRFVWRIILQQAASLSGTALDGENITKHLEEVSKRIASAPKSNRVELESFPLYGVGPNRNSKGNVGPVGKVAVGPAARR